MAPVRHLAARPTRFLARTAAVNARSFSSAAPAGAGGGGGFSFPGPTELDAIVKLDMLRGLEPSEIARVWLEHHATNAEDGAGDAAAGDAADTGGDDDEAAAELTDTTIGLVLDKGRYEKLAQRVKAAPMFVLPVFRDGGFFNVLLQFQDTPPRVLLFTGLDDFRADPAGAQPYLACSLFDDLKDEKGLVLVRGEITQQLTKSEAADLLDTTLRMYLGADGRGLAGRTGAGADDPADEGGWELVDRFNNAPATFDPDDILALCEKLMGVRKVVPVEAADAGDDEAGSR